MTDVAPVEVTNLDRYGSDALPWSRARDVFATGSASPDVTFFLGTVRPDGRPHAAGVGAAWHDGDLYFTASPDSRKARNLAADPACTLWARLAGIDLVVEGTAVRVTDAGVLEQVVAIYPGRRLAGRSGRRRLHGALQRSVSG